MRSPSSSHSKSMSHGAETPPTVAASSMSSEPKSVQSESANLQTDNAKAMLIDFLTKRLGPPSLTFPPTPAEPEPRIVNAIQSRGSLPLHQPSLSETQRWTSSTKRRSKIWPFFSHVEGWNARGGREACNDPRRDGPHDLGRWPEYASRISEKPSLERRPEIS